MLGWSREVHSHPAVLNAYAAHVFSACKPRQENLNPDFEPLLYSHPAALTACRTRVLCLQGGSLVSNSAGAAAFAQLMARMVPALRNSLVEDIKQAAVQAEVKEEEAA
jgi:hypothetical protein